MCKDYCKHCDDTGYQWDGGPCYCPTGQALAERALAASDARRDAFNEAVSRWPECPDCKGSGSIGKGVYQMCRRCGGVGRGGPVRVGGGRGA